MTNPCDEDVDYMSTSGCLVGSVSYEGPTSGSEAPFCTSAITFFTVPASSQISESYPLGTMDAGDYTLSVNFNGSGGTAESEFTVEPEPEPEPEPVPDFSLTDDNPLSPSFGETLSPRDLMGQVTGWYFIKAT